MTYSLIHKSTSLKSLLKFMFCVYKHIYMCVYVHTDMKYRLSILIIYLYVCIWAITPSFCICYAYYTDVSYAFYSDRRLWKLSTKFARFEIKAICWMRTNWFYDERNAYFPGNLQRVVLFCNRLVRSAIVWHYTDKSFDRTGITERFITDR